MLRKSVFTFLILQCLLVLGQQPVRDFSAVEGIDWELMESTYATNKVLPLGFERQALLALSHFPELKNSQISFKLTTDYTPLASRPTIWSVFRKPSNRHYIISISTKSKGILDSIILGNLNFNAQIGVLAHEISHVADYHTMGFWQFVRLGFGLLSTNYMDAFEYRTDSICIEHGAGFQLLAWSKQVRQYFTPEVMKQFFGEKALTKERYMTPETILKKIQTNSNYDHLTKTN